MSPSTKRKHLIHNAPIPNCYKPDYLKEKEEFYNLEKYTRLEGDFFERNILYTADERSLVKWKNIMKADKRVQAQMHTDYNDMKYIEREYNKQRFNVKGNTRLYVSEISNKLHKGLPVSKIKYEIKLVKPHCVKVQNRIVRSLNTISTNRSVNNDDKSVHELCVTRHGDASHKEVVLPVITANAKEEVELNEQSDLEEVLRKRVMTRLKQENSFYNRSNGKDNSAVVKRFQNKIRHVRNKVFKPVEFDTARSINKSYSHKVYFINNVSIKFNIGAAHNNHLWPRYGI